MMTVKQIEQFRCDYFGKDEEIAVNCVWLQQLLASNDKLTRQITALHNENDLLKSRLAMRDIDIPQYRLDVRG